jgi:hypothetical protein
MLPYTPVPIALPADIDLPQDVIDDVVVATVNPWAQELADAIAFRDRISRQVSRYFIPTGTFDPATPIVLSPWFEGPGMTYAAGEITFDDGGTYLFVANLILQSDNASANISQPMRIVSSGPLTGDGIIARGFRWSGTIGNFFPVTGCSVQTIEAGDAVSLRTVIGSADVNFDASGNLVSEFSVIRLNDRDAP